MRIAPYVALASRALEANFRRPDFPFKLTFCVTFWCNYRCQTCNISKMAPRDELSLGEIRRFFARSGRFLWVDLTGGEVTLRRDFIDVCHAVIDGCSDLLLLHFPTNGYLTDKVVAAAEAITTRPGRRPEKLIVTVSTDGDETTNDRIRGIEGGWRRQLETGRTPMRCHALSASCFVDSWGNVFPCTIYDRRIGSLRDVDYDLARLWSTPEADRLEREIFDYRCPQCWTPCEAYPSIMGNFVTRGRRPAA